MFTPGPILGEFFGTLVLVVFGDGNVANLVLKDSKANGSNWVHICWGCAWAVGLGVFAANALGSAQGDLNPVVTVAKTLAGTYGSWGEAFGIIIAQMCGGFCGGVVVWLAYLSHWKGSDPSAQLGVFCTAPNKSEADRNLFHCNILPRYADHVRVLEGSCWRRLHTRTRNVLCRRHHLRTRCGTRRPDWLRSEPCKRPFTENRTLRPSGAYSWVPVVGPLVGAVCAYYFCHACGIM